MIERRNLQGQELIGYLDSFVNEKSLVNVELTIGEIWYIIRRIEKAERKK